MQLNVKYSENSEIKIQRKNECRRPLKREKTYLHALKLLYMQKKIMCMYIVMAQKLEYVYLSAA